MGYTGTDINTILIKVQMKRLLYCIPALALFCVSCEKDADMHTLDNSEEICFTVESVFNAEVKTKATSAVTELASFNVNAVKGALGSTETSIFNAEFTKDGSSSTYKGGKYWPATDPSYRFYASNVKLTPSAEGPVVEAGNTTDIVCAVLADPSFKTSNALVFSHIFARIGFCNIIAPEGYAVSGLEVTLTPKTGGLYNLYAGNGKTDGTGWSSVSEGSSAMLASSIGSTIDNGLYLVPGNYVLSASYTLTAGDYSESFTKTSSVSIVGGKINNISATLPEGGAQQIAFTVSVAPWETNNITATLS